MLNTTQTSEYLKKYNFLLLFVILLMISSAFSPNFLTIQNLLNIWQQSSILGVVSIGATFVILIAGIDLSAGAVVAVSGMIVSLAATGNAGLVLGVILAVTCGIAIGLFNGLISTLGKVPGFITTLATMSAGNGLALIITRGKPIYNLPASLQFLGGGYVGSLPLMGIIWVVLSIIAGIVLKWLPFGRHVYAVGGNSEAARLSGIKTKTIAIIAYTVSGFLAAIAGILLAGWLTVGYPT
ncbi:MAG: ABC transporter permease [Peptococcaceae bacterium]|jgi:ribose transport system permease protein|nr:ABC transporter permease [Peptococcaceae bacterium]